MRIPKYICDENTVYVVKNAKKVEGNPHKIIRLDYQKLEEKRKLEYINLDETIEI